MSHPALQGQPLAQHRSIHQQFIVKSTVQNLLTPGDELGFRVDLKQPYVFGGADTKKTALAISAFNVRKVSGVFIPGAKASALGFLSSSYSSAVVASWVH